MPSQARIKFDKNCRDVTRLLEIHQHVGGSARGRRFELEVLNKSAIVLICAFWEAFCEDRASEAIRVLVKRAIGPDSLTVELRKRIARDLKANLHELAVWQLAGRGWRAYLESRIVDLQEERNRKLNTPKTAKIDELFLENLGINQISSSWHWNRMSAAQAAAKLDHFVELRGSIAHRGQALAAVTKATVVDYFEFIRKLVDKTGIKVTQVVRQAIGQVRRRRAVVRVARRVRGRARVGQPQVGNAAAGN